MGWLRQLADWIDPPKTKIGLGGLKSQQQLAMDDAVHQADMHSARVDAKNRLKLVLMHDRTQLSPLVLEKMRDDMVEVISRYVEIDREALEVNLENESNTIALVASIPVLRARND